MDEIGVFTAFRGERTLREQILLNTEQAERLKS
jgi:hypothetical protein